MTTKILTEEEKQEIERQRLDDIANICPYALAEFVLYSTYKELHIKPEPKLQKELRNGLEMYYATRWKKDCMSYAGAWIWARSDYARLFCLLAGKHYADWLDEAIESIFYDELIFGLRMLLDESHKKHNLKLTSNIKDSLDRARLEQRMCQ